jgi:hypothetical protein
MYSDVNITTASKESKALTAELSAEGVADADNPRKILLTAWQDWITDLCDWKSMLTMTIANEHMCYRDGLGKRWQTFVQILNRDLYGNNYTRRVGHSYFSYVQGVEYQTREVLHLHVLVDQPVNYQLMQKLWNHMSGFIWIKPVPDKRGAVEYISKYVIKGEDLRVYKQPLEVLPRPNFMPFWYHDNLLDGHPHKDFFLCQIK